MVICHPTMFVFLENKNKKTDVVKEAAAEKEFIHGDSTK